MNAFTKPEQQALFLLRRTSGHRQSICSNYARYAHLKQQWIAAHPDATSTQYDVAMSGIARESGV